MVNNKRNWGIVALTIFVLAAGGFIYWQLSSVQQLKEQVAQDNKLLERTDAPEVQHAASFGDQKPPDEPGFEWVRHGDHWDKVPVSKSAASARAAAPAAAAPAAAAPAPAEYGITRQGKRYKRNPSVADIPAATATPTGPPLHIEWQDGGHPKPGSGINWKDPRTWESYRNFWGFDPPKFIRQLSGLEYRPTLDNWGTPLQHFNSTFMIRHYKKRIGFRPSPEQLAEYKALQAQLETARVNGEPLRADRLRQEMLLLRESARGELPIRHTYRGFGYGPADFADDPEVEKALSEAAEREVYKRMGIEHLYEFYEKGH